MARPLRIEYPGALYHVMSRGNAYQNIYLDDTDRRVFLNNLAQCIEDHNLVCHAYCLMGNHYHLLLETPDGNLSNAMRDINGNYTQRFNTRQERVGHVLQGRYKAFVVEKEPYLLEVARYIVNNPITAKMVEHTEEWQWSSYRSTAGLAKQPYWLETNFTLGLFSKNKKEAEHQYRQFVQARLYAESPYREMKEGVILGSPQFVDWIWETQTNGSEGVKDIPRHQRVVGRPRLEELFKNIHDLQTRNTAICIARKRCGYLNTEIANFLGISNSTVGKIVRGTYNVRN